MNALADAAPTSGPSLDNRRVAAALIDLLVLFAVGFGLAAVFGGMSVATQALAVAWALYYYFGCESGEGQTVGKKLMRIRVVSADGGPMRMSQVAVRTLLRVIDGVGLYLVGLVAMLATGKRRQRLGDLAAGTVVTSADAPVVTPVAPAPGAGAAMAAPEAVEPAPAVEPEVEPAPSVEPEVEPVPAVEPEVEEPEDRPVLEPVPPAEPDAGTPPEPVVREEDDAQDRSDHPGIEIVSNPIEMIMADEPADPDSEQPSGSVPAEQSPPSA